MKNGLISCMLLLFLGVMGWAAEPNFASYAESQKQAMADHKPLVVLVSTTWCEPCKRMKAEVIPTLVRRGVFRRVHFTLVDPDQDRELARAIMNGNSIPQLALYYHAKTGWRVRHLVGYTPAETVEQHINDVVEKGDTQ